MKERAHLHAYAVAYLVTMPLSFLWLSVPGLSFCISPFLGMGFFSFLLRALLMVSPQCFGKSWGRKGGEGYCHSPTNTGF